MTENLVDDTTTLVQVMDWRCQATSNYLDWLWPGFSIPYVVTRPHRVNKQSHSKHVDYACVCEWLVVDRPTLFYCKCHRAAICSNNVDDTELLAQYYVTTDVIRYRIATMILMLYDHWTNIDICDMYFKSAGRCNNNDNTWPLIVYRRFCKTSSCSYIADGRSDNSLAKWMWISFLWGFCWIVPEQACFSLSIFCFTSRVWTNRIEHNRHQVNCRILHFCGSINQEPRWTICLSFALLIIFIYFMANA